MGVNVVNTADGANIVDMTGNTVTEDTLGEGVTAQNAQGETITGTFPIGEVDTQADLISQIKTMLNGKTAGGGSSGSGIIDVTELPTSNIDENAVYRVTENIQTEKTEIYILASGVVTFRDYLASRGISTVPNVYVVDELSNMLPTDVQTFSAIHLYILKSDGIAYVAPAYGEVITVGLFGFQAMGYDKGFTENIYEENDAGVYTTIEKYKQIEQWFVRENGEWKEITAHTEATTPHGFTNTEVLSGDVTSKVYTIADILSGEVTEFDKNWFVTRTGEPIDQIKPYFFSGCKFTSVTIPKSIYYLDNDVFNGCINLETVTFESSSMATFGDVFNNCPNLTTINVPWAEGAFPSAPWGAQNATINYNYTGE
jgi:hypothetical protein